MPEHDPIIKHIRSKTWGNFNTRAAHLLVRTMQLKGVEMMKRKMRYQMHFEDLCVCHSHQEQLRISSMDPFFSGKAVAYFRDNPDTVLEYIAECENLIRKSRKIISRFEQLAKQNDEDKLAEYICDIVDALAIIGHWKYYITAVFIRAFSRDEDDKFRAITRRFGQWKNNEENYNFEEDFLIKAGHAVVRRRRLPAQGKYLTRYLEVDEFLGWLKQQIAAEMILSTIERRKKNGYVQINLSAQVPHSWVLEAATDQARAVKEHIYALHAQAIAANKTLSGIVAYADQPLVSGECAVIGSCGRLLRSVGIDGKILVASMTTPEFIPYIEKAKGIITDTGGLACHAAILAREFRIPAIVGAINATKSLKTGDEIEMDLKTGKVKKLNL